MTRTRLAWGAALLLLSADSTQVRGVPQSGGRSASQSGDDSPVSALSRWKAAVLAGDKPALSAFYSLSPPAQATTPEGKSSDPSEESNFWSGLTAKGLTSLDLKILDVAEVQPGMVGLALRAELTMRSDSGEQQFVVSPLEEFWSKHGDAWQIVRTHRSDLDPAPELKLPEPVTPNTDLYPPPEQAASDIAKAVEAASREHKRVIVVFGATWCFDCHVLDAAFRSPRIAPLVQANFVLVMVNIGDGDKNLDLAKKYDVPVSRGVPALAVLDSDGKLLESQKRGEFQSVTRLAPSDIIQFLDRWKSVRDQ